MDSHISKPVLRSELVEKVLQALAEAAEGGAARGGSTGGIE
jgi:hypothetical protein